LETLEQRMVFIQVYNGRKRNTHNRHSITCTTKQTSTEATHKIKYKHPKSATHAAGQNGPSRTAEPLKQRLPTSQATTAKPKVHTYRNDDAAPILA